MQLAAVKTPATPQAVADALCRAWPLEMGGEPAKVSVLILLAQWALETAEGVSMVCFNIGNAKQPTDDHDWCAFSTFEYVNGQRVDIHPPDPGCRFRAFQTLDDGVRDYLHGMWARWTKAWPSVIAGDPEGFAAGLHAQGYYTAPEAQYAAGVRRYLDKYMRTVSVLPPALPTTPEPMGVVYDLVTDPQNDTIPPPPDEVA